MEIKMNQHRIYWLNTTQLCELQLLIDLMLEKKASKSNRAYLEKAKKVLDDIALTHVEQPYFADSVIKHDDCIPKLLGSKSTNYLT